MKKLLLKALKKIMNKSPRWVQDEVVRRTITISETIPENFTFKIAENESELEDAFRLVYEAYVKLGYCDENLCQMRATIWHALSTTSTLLALDDGKVIGTLTVVRDNALKLPSEKIFDMKAIRGNSRRLAEITSLVIDPEYRRQNGGNILFNLLKFMHEYSTNYFGVDYLVVTVHPKDAFFYRSLLLFKDIPGTGVKDYLGAPAVALSLDLNEAFVQYQEIYDKRPDSANLFRFFFKLKNVPNLHYPKKVYNKINYPLVSVAYFQDLFVNKLKITDEELAQFEEAFVYNKIIMQRDYQRVEVELPTFLRMAGSKVEICGRMKDVSRRGFKFFCIHTLAVGEEYECEVFLTSHIKAMVTAKIVWSKENDGVGFSIISADKRWNEFIDYLYEEHQGKVA